MGATLCKDGSLSGWPKEESATCLGTSLHEITQFNDGRAHHVRLGFWGYGKKVVSAKMILCILLIQYVLHDRVHLNSLNGKKCCSAATILGLV